MTEICIPKKGPFYQAFTKAGASSFWYLASMKYLLVLILAIILAACSNPKHPDLLSFQSQAHRQLTLEELENGGEVQTVIKDSIRDNILHVHLFQKQAGCMTFDGDIEILGDTILLDFWHTGDVVCDELMVYHMNYQIQNPNAKTYLIQVKP